MIPNNKPKGNIRLEALAMPLIIVLVGLAAFGLGRLSKDDTQKPALIVHTEGQVTGSTTPTI